MDDSAVSSPPGQQLAAAGSSIAAPTGRGDRRQIDITIIMPTAFWCGAFVRCARRILALVDRASASIEVIFALDGAASAPEWLDHPAARIVATGRRSGPAAARNRAAEKARGGVLLFVDSDVELGDGSIDLIAATLEREPDLVGVFGTYDDEPTADGTVSAFRNLLHHHIHVSHAGQAATFWSGCGAMRTSAFLDSGGFSEEYAYPSVEDIELGMRVAAAGGRIVLLPELTCKHLKRWTVASMMLTDIVHRAGPWTRLIMRSREFPAALNIDWRSRLSGVAAVLLAACLAVAGFASIASLTPIASSAILAALACGLILFWINRDFYRLCARKRGLGFATSAMAFHWLYFVYASLTFGAVAIWEVVTRWRPTVAVRAHRVSHEASSAA